MGPGCQGLTETLQVLVALLHNQLHPLVESLLSLFVIAILHADQSDSMLSEELFGATLIRM